MNLKKFSFYVIIFIKCTVLFSQNIKGIVKNSNGVNLENASITLWSSASKEGFVGYTYTNGEGIFSFNLQKENKTLFVEVACINYANTSRTVDDFSKAINFVLTDKVIVLEEVKILNERPVRVKNDSTLYDPKKFLNGTERKVQDLIKKLPGMTVNETTGEIKFKGKSVETVKLEDDDLFGSNYAIGTKNISVDMVEQVQAIENYSVNKLLKGIENSDAVVINLKLKKNKTDYSGSSSFNNGFGKKLMANDDVTVLGISKKVKSFGLFSYTNFGVNNENLEPNYLDFTKNIKEDLFTKKNISDSSGSSKLPAARTNYNNNFNLNYNLLYHLSDKFSVKNSFYFYTDKSTINDSYNNSYFLNNNEKIENTTQNSFSRSPNYFRIDTKLMCNLNDLSLIQSNIIFKKEIINSETNTIQNNLSPFNSKLKTDNFFLNANLEYTLKIADKKALQVFSLFSSNNLPQTLTSNKTLATGINANNNVQFSSFQKDIYAIKAVYLENRKGLKHSLSVGFNASRVNLNSRFYQDNLSITDFKNQFDYNKNDFFAEYISSISWRNFSLQTFVYFNQINQFLNNQVNFETQKKNSTIVSPIFVISYFLNKHSSFFLSANTENKTPSEDVFFSNKILANSIDIKTNIPSLNIIKSESISLNYKYYDLLNQFTLTLTGMYSNNHNTFLPKLDIYQNFSATTLFQSPENIDNKKFIFSIEKQINPLKLNIKETNSFTISNYKNALTNFELRNNKSNSFNNHLSLVSFFNIPINFENSLDYSYISYQNNDDDASKRITINNTLRFIIKPIKNTIVTLSQDYFVPDISNEVHFSFLDFSITYKSEKHKWLSFNFYGKNLLNLDNFTIIENNDYSYSVYQSQLLPRHFLLSMNLDF
jgi:hypothetical protein